ncbi:MAG TPA: GntR family transcriptional regulator [Streptosporangiaceae bacterium]|nr:GntR family transcriptional regulator [Streptosporangiaceae bacterium]
MPLPHTLPRPARVSARDTAYEQLRDWITLGPLEPGEPILDTEIAELLGMSRTPVREALLRLAQDGLVETFPGRQTRVAPLRLDRAPHLFAIGGALDALAAEQATPRLTAGELSGLAATLEQMGGPEKPQDLQTLDERFHAIYYQASGNQPLVDMLQGITLELRRFDRAGFRDLAIMAAANDEHAAILAAFRNRDDTAAARIARQNWVRSWARLEPVFRARGG